MAPGGPSLTAAAAKAQPGLSELKETLSEPGRQADFPVLSELSTLRRQLHKHVISHVRLLLQLCPVPGQKAQAQSMGN